MTNLKQRAEALREAIYYHERGNMEALVLQAAQTLLRVMEYFAEYQDCDVRLKDYEQHLLCRAEILKLMGE